MADKAQKLGPRKEKSGNWIACLLKFVQDNPEIPKDQINKEFWDKYEEFDQKLLGLFNEVISAPNVKAAHLALNKYLLSYFGSEKKLDWDDFKARFAMIMEESVKNIDRLRTILNLEEEGEKSYISKVFFEKFLKMYAPLEPSSNYRTGTEFYTLPTILDSIKYPFVHGLQVVADDDPKILRDCQPGDYFFRFGSQGDGIYALVYKLEDDVQRWRILSDPRDGPTFQVKGTKYNSLQEIIEKSQQIFGMKLENPVNRIGATINRGIKVLALDGGGIRGLVPISILQRIEKDMRKPIHEIFDVICGTSTGGILALGVGLKRLPLKLCEEKYSSMGTTIFKKGLVASLNQLFGEKHKTSELEKLLKELAGEDSILTDSSKPKVFTVSVSQETNAPFLFRNYELKNAPYRGTKDAKVWQAGRATSAAPTFFSSCNIPELGVFLDGALGHNNPTREAIDEVQAMIKEDPEFKDRPIECIVSIGTGEEPINIQAIRGKTWAVADSLAKMSEIALGSDKRAEEDHRYCEKEKIPYYRFNPPNIGGIPLDEEDSSVLKLMKHTTEEYLLKVETQKKLNDLYTHLQ